jgi:hypothetical protein
MKSLVMKRLTLIACLISLAGCSGGGGTTPPSTGSTGGSTVAPPAAAAPVFSANSGTFNSAQQVTITDATGGANIYYTTNGATPTNSSNVYTSAITVAATETIKAMAAAPNYSDSAVTSATYTINPPAGNNTAPSFIQAVSALCNVGSSGTQCSDTLSIAITTKAGSAILVPLWFNSASQCIQGSDPYCIQVSDSNNDSFTPWAIIPTEDLNAAPAFLYGAINVAGGTVVVNLTFSAVPASAFAGALEYSGISHGVDGSVSSYDLLTQQSQGQQISSGALAINSKDELAFGIGMADFGLQAGSGWTARLGCEPSQYATLGSGAGYFCFEEQSTTQVDSIDAVFTTDFHSAGGLGGPPTSNAPNGYGTYAVSIY